MSTARPGRSAASLEYFVAGEPPICAGRPLRNGSSVARVSKDFRHAVESAAERTNGRRLSAPETRSACRCADRRNATRCVPLRRASQRKRGTADVIAVRTSCRRAERRRRRCLRSADAASVAAVNEAPSAVAVKSYDGSCSVPSAGYLRKSAHGLGCGTSRYMLSFRHDRAEYGGARYVTG